MDLTRVKRSTAFLVHFGISLSLFAVLVTLMLTQWFPGPYFEVDGGWQGIRVIAFVDLVLGPALTLMFFRPHRKPHRELKFDLSLIAAAQVIALVWGVWTVYNSRPVSVVFHRHYFSTVPHSGLAEADARIRQSGLEPRDPAALSDDRPPLLYAEPFRGDAFQEYFNGVLNDDMPEIQERSDRYRPLPFDDQFFTGRQVVMESVESQYPELARQLRERLRTDERPLQAYEIRTRFADGIALIDARDGGRMVEILPYRWR